MPRSQSNSSASKTNTSECGGSNNRGGGNESGTGGRRKAASDQDSKGSDINGSKYTAGSRGGSAKSERPVSVQHSTGSAKIGSDSTGSGLAENSSSVKTYVDNATNRKLGRVGQPYGKESSQSSIYPADSSVNPSSESLSIGCSTKVKTYADTAQNRKLGRVGQPYARNESEHSSLSTCSDRNPSSSSKVTDSVKTYVDNAQNRSLGRVGQPYHKNDSSQSFSRSTDSGYVSSTGSLPTDTDSSVKTYVDNPKNRQLGRVGQPYNKNLSQSFSHSTDNGITPSYGSLPTGGGASVKTYVDNAQNRKLGRVGQPYTKSGLTQSCSESDKYADRSAPVCKTETARIQGSSKWTSSKPKVPDIAHASSTSAIRVYKDSPLNRRLDRVGKPLGTMMYTKKGNRTSKVYADSAFNRFMNRVGKPLGSQPVSNKSKATKKKQEIIKSILDDECDDSLHFDERMDKLQFDAKHTYDTRHADLEKSAMREAIYQINRIIEEVQWTISSKTKDKPATEKSVLTNFTGQIIDFKEVKKGKQIGRGGFGDVFFASWKGTAVAVKTLHKQTVSQERLRRFTEEIQTFSSLNHPSIVKFIGACIESPNLAIVMEYMQTSLFDEIHINESDFSDEECLSILRQTSAGLQYLHGRNIAHCDMKSQNVLLDNGTEGITSIKIVDFGLSMVKSDAETSSVSEDRVQKVGTARYSAPEVLRGNELSAKDMMKADIYSLGLIVYEVLFQIEPFDDFTATQLQEQVGRKGKLPIIPDDQLVTNDVGKLMKSCLSKDPSNRPEIKDISSFFKDISRLYI